MATMKCDLQAMNWLARVLDPTASFARLGDPNQEVDILRGLVERSSEMSRLRPLATIAGIGGTSEYMAGPKPTASTANKISSASDFMTAVRDRLAQRSWTALIVPSYDEEALDSFLCSEGFKASLVRQSGNKNGLILQPHCKSERAFDLTDVFPSFLAALGEATKWPGLLVWTQSSESVFLALPQAGEEMIQACATWIIARLVAMSPVNLKSLKEDYLKQFPAIKRRYSRVLHLLQISDVHLGSRIARQRLPRVQALIEKEVEQLRQSGSVRPIITGDLLNSPNDSNVDDAESFLYFLHSLKLDDPAIVLGNHDVRKSGIIGEDFKAALNLPTSPVVWIPDYMVGLVCFNSVIRGRLARGFIGEKQFMRLGTCIENQKDSSEYALIGLLHHHPMPVRNPGWLKIPFYARWLGRFFERTVELKDARQFRQFVTERSMRAVLHGHKHVPREGLLSKESAIPVFGCGSSVGKIKTRDGGPYISINVVTIDPAANKLVGRLLIEKFAGAGFEEERHERILRMDLVRHN